MQVAQHLIIEGTRRLLTVSGDKRNGVSFINQLYGSFHLPFLHFQFILEF